MIKLSSKKLPTLNSQTMRINCLMEMMMLEHLLFLIFLYPVKMKKKSYPTLFGNMPMIFHSNSPHFILMVKVSAKGVKHQSMDDMELFCQWDEKYLSIGELSTSYLVKSWDKGNPEFLKTNSINNLHMLWKYLHHLVREAQESSIPGNPFSILLPDQFCNLTWKDMET